MRGFPLGFVRLITLRAFFCLCSSGAALQHGLNQRAGRLLYYFDKFIQGFPVKAYGL